MQFAGQLQSWQHLVHPKPVCDNVLTRSALQVSARVFVISPVPVSCFELKIWERLVSAAVAHNAGSPTAWTHIEARRFLPASPS